MKLTMTGVDGIPMIEPGDDLVAIISAAMDDMDLAMQSNDVIVIAQKIVSKSEDRYVYLDQITPGPEAVKLAMQVDKDPRLVEVILSESAAVVRQRPGVLIVEHKLGFVHANAGIDQSNIEQLDGRERVLLLPVDSDASAASIRAGFKDRYGVDVAIIINDSIGRAWRIGSLGLAIGVAGMVALEDYVGATDIFNRELVVTQVGAADEMAAGASLVMGQTDERSPVVHVRGYQPKQPPGVEQQGVKSLIRPRDMDMFR